MKWSHNNWEDESFVDSYVGYISTNENLAWYSIVNATNWRWNWTLAIGRCDIVENIHET